MMEKECFGCKYLYKEHDAAGGGTYKCKRHYGVVLGEFGHWTDKSDIPRRIFEDCPEA